MIQLNAEQYKTVNAALQLLDVPQQGSNRLAEYAFAKEVVVYGCAAAEQSEQCTRCASYLLPMCQAVQQVTTEQPPLQQDSLPTNQPMPLPQSSTYFLTDSSL
jgi:hypothetical protein